MRNDRQQRPDYYRILGISPDATQGEVREAYRQAAKRWHPDLNPSAEAAARMREVNEAWRVLGDETIRAGYDRARRDANRTYDARPVPGGDVPRGDYRSGPPGGGSAGGNWSTQRTVVAAVAVVAVATVGVILMAVIATGGEDPVPPTARAPVATWTPRPTSTPVATPIWGMHQASGYNLVAREEANNSVGCPSQGSISDFFQGRVEFDFIVPSVDRWSVGVFYHRHPGRNHDSAAVLAKNRSGRIQADHWTRTEWDELSRAPYTPLEPSESRIFPGDTVRFALQSDGFGSRLYVDGDLKLHVRPYDLRPISSPLKICAGFFNGEPQPYSVNVTKFRAGYSKSAAESTAIAR